MEYIKKLAGAGLVTVFATTLTIPVFAQDIKYEQLSSDQVVGDFLVGPGKVELELNPGESKTVNVTLSNRMGTEKTFTVDIEDFVGSETTEQTVVLLGDRRGPYSLQDYLVVPSQEMTVGHAERVVVPITVSVPTDAEPGGRYGTVLFQTKSEPNEDSQQPSASIISRIGVLFFVTVPGDIKYEGSVEKFDTSSSKRIYDSGPVDFEILYRNTGNVHINPYGRISIRNMFGSEVGAVELDPWFAMPQSLRLRQATWDRGWLFGKYKAVLSINKGYDNIVETREIDFYVLPWKPISAAVVIVAIFIFLLTKIFSTFEIKRKN